MAGVVQRSLEERFWEKVRKSEGCWSWTAYKNKAGYGMLSRANKLPPMLASRVSWELNRGPLGPGDQVLHRCDNPSCVRPDHLFIGTPAINCLDKKTKGRAKISGQWLDNMRASRAVARKLRPDQEREVARLYQAGATKAGLGRMFEIHPSTVAEIVKRQIQRH